MQRGENFDRLIEEGFLRQEEKPCYFLYRQGIGLVASGSRRGKS
jgi:hypothetical protein